MQITIRQEKPTERTQNGTQRTVREVAQNGAGCTEPKYFFPVKF